MTGRAVRREFARLWHKQGPGGEMLRGRQARQELAWFSTGPEDAVLDLACGPGSYTLELARRARLVLGADVTWEALRRARKRAADGARRVGQGRLWFLAADAHGLPFADAAFDLVVCGFSFPHFAAPEQVVREMARVLRPGGRAAVVEVVADHPLINRLERLRERIYTRVLTGAGLVRLFREAGMRVERQRHFLRPTRFRRWAAESNLRADSPALERARRLLEQAAAGGDRALHLRRVGDDWLFCHPVMAFEFFKAGRV